MIGRMKLTTGLMLVLASGIAAATLAQALPQPSPSGDFYSNDAPIKGVAQRPLAAGSLWRVSSLKLSCHQAPGANQPIVRQFRQGDVLQVEVYRGGSDEVLLNSKDANGKPWMPVRGQNFSDRCFVRANSRYIQPVVESN